MRRAWLWGTVRVRLVSLVGQVGMARRGIQARSDRPLILCAHHEPVSVLGLVIYSMLLIQVSKRIEYRSRQHKPYPWSAIATGCQATDG